MTKTIGYDFSTAEAICNDATKNTWEVRAIGSDGNKWCVSDSAEMTEADAEELAQSMRDEAAENA